MIELSAYATVSAGRLIDRARSLLDDPLGTNPEYERALVEILMDTLGFTRSEAEAVLARQEEVHWRPWR